ncbi:hypothetical protein D9M71_611280 [compost metagenome]
MKNLTVALAEHVARGLLAADAASAEHRDLLVHGRVEVGFDVVGKFAKTGGFRVDGAFEGANRDFVIVAGVDQQHFRVADQRVPVLWIDVGADLFVRVHAFHAEGDDFFLEFDLGAVERLLVAVRLFMVDVVHARVVLEPGHQPVDAFAAAGHGAVDAFFGNQQGAFDAVVDHRLQQGLAQGDVIFQGDELIQCRHDNLLCHG